MSAIHRKYIASTLIILIALMVLVKSNLILFIDEPVYRLVRLLHNIPFANTFLSCYSDIFSPWHMVGVMVVILTILLFKDRRLAYITAIWATSILLLGIGLKYFIHRPRPVDYISGYSFPSLHTLTIAIAGVVFLMLFRRFYWHILVYLMVFIMMISRIYLHAHYFSDTVASIVFEVLCLQVTHHYLAKYNLDIPFTTYLSHPRQKRPDV